MQKKMAKIILPSINSLDRSDDSYNRIGKQIPIRSLKGKQNDEILSATRREVRKLLLSFIEELRVHYHQLTKDFEHKARESINYFYFAEHIDNPHLKELFVLLIPQASSTSFPMRQNPIHSVDRLEKRLEHFCKKTDKDGKQRNMKSLVGQLGKLTQYMKEKAIIDFKKKVDRSLINIGERQRQIQQNEEATGPKYREILREYSVHSNPKPFHKPINERIRDMENKYFRFSKISLSLLEQDRILVEADKTKDKGSSFPSIYEKIGRYV